MSRYRWLGVAGFLLKSSCALAVVYVFPQDIGPVLTKMSQEPEKLIVSAIKIHTASGYRNSQEILELFTKRRQNALSTIVISESRLTSAEGQRPIAVGSPLAILKKTGVSIVSDLAFFRKNNAKLAVSKKNAWIGTGYDSGTGHDGAGTPLGVEERDFLQHFSATERPDVVTQAEAIFSDLAVGKTIDPAALSFDFASLKPGKSAISWGPWHLREDLRQLIAQASKTISIYQQDLQDSDICTALEQKAQAGVAIRILMSDVPFRSPENLEKRINESKPNLLKLSKLDNVACKLTGIDPTNSQRLPLHIHAKIVLVDGDYMYLGSANFHPDVLNPDKKTLTVGVITRSIDDIQAVSQQFEEDWQDQRALLLGSS